MLWHVSFQVSSSEAAEQLGIKRRQVLNLLAAGQLAGHKVGRDWVVYQSSVDAYGRKRKPAGRPPGRAQKQPKSEIPSTTEGRGSATASSPARAASEVPA